MESIEGYESLSLENLAILDAAAGPELAVLLAEKGAAREAVVAHKEEAGRPRAARRRRQRRKLPGWQKRVTRPPRRKPGTQERPTLSG